jgi:ATP-binding cassette subfamily B protein
MKNQQDAIIGLTYADLLEISQLGVTILMGFTLMLISSVSIPQSIVSIKRVNEILDLKIDMKDPLKPVTSFNTTGKIEFKNVNFKYEGSEQNILTNISFTIKKGQTLGIVGPNGSGKSTLISLIPRFFDPKKGEILINDVNIKKINLKMLRSKIGYVGQKSFLFSGSIKENISYGLSTPPQDEHLNFISRNAEALEFIDTLPMKYNSVVSQNANNFSGGQKQRLSIARALAINPEILIFDDSFSALDLKTDKVLRGKLQNKFKHVTKIIVAQRVNTILDADKIIVLDDGKIIGMGTHQQLLKNCPLYCDITSSQLEQKEVATNEK